LIELAHRLITEPGISSKHLEKLRTQLLYFSEESDYPERLAPLDRVVIKKQNRTKEALKFSSSEANAHSQVSALNRTIDFNS
jgi:hypothetical protein